MACYDPLGQGRSEKFNDVLVTPERLEESLSMGEGKHIRCVALIVILRDFIVQFQAPAKAHSAARVSIGSRGREPFSCPPLPWMRWASEG